MNWADFELPAIGLVLSVAGVVLILGARRPWLLAYGRLLTPNVAAARRFVMLQGFLMLGGGSLLVGLTIIGYLLQLDPRPAARARESFAQAQARPTPPGRSLDDAVTATLSGNGRDLVEIRNPVFLAHAHPSLCGTLELWCDPDPLQEWYGQLTWEERRGAGAGWKKRTCRAFAAVSAQGAWRISINFNLCNDPAAA